MSATFEAQHPRESSGRFAHADERRTDPGQVLRAPPPSPPKRSPVGPATPQFTVLSDVELSLATKLMERREQTLHMRDDRRSRLAMASPGDLYRAFAVTRDGRSENAEVHVVTRSAEVWVFSARTGKLITILFARPQQVVRYFGKERVDEDVMDEARANVALARNTV